MRWSTSKRRPDLNPAWGWTGSVQRIDAIGQSGGVDRPVCLLCRGRSESPAHQQHPHVHLIVKAENEPGQRQHIERAMLRNWREHFARPMCEQGAAANATPRNCAWSKPRVRRAEPPKLEISVYCFRIKITASNAATHTHHGTLIGLFFGFETGGVATG
jgi:hypothetical protein